MLVRSGAVDVVVVDSVAALTPKAEIEGEMGDSHMGLQARLMSQALRKLTGNIKRSNCLVIFINQIRMKIGVMFGNPETTTGGNALKFYASVRLDIRRIGAIKKGEEVIGSETRVKVVKNKVAPPFKRRSSRSCTAHGISREGEIVDLGVQAEHHREVGRLVQLQGRAHRPGQGERARVPDRAQGHRGRPSRSEIRAELLPKKVPGRGARGCRGGGCGAPSLTGKPTDEAACKRGRRRASRPPRAQPPRARAQARRARVSRTSHCAGARRARGVRRARRRALPKASFVRVRERPRAGTYPRRARRARGVSRRAGRGAAARTRHRLVAAAPCPCVDKRFGARRRGLQGTCASGALPPVPRIRPRSDRPRARLRGRPRLRPPATRGTITGDRRCAVRLGEQGRLAA